MLRLNPAKIEVLWLGKEDLGLGCQLLVLEGVHLTLAQTISILGVVLGACLSMEAQITNVTKLAFC